MMVNPEQTISKLASHERDRGGEFREIVNISVTLLRNL